MVMRHIPQRYSQIEPDWNAIDAILQKHGLDFRAVLNEIEKYI
jgi:hypothetical protein